MIRKLQRRFILITMVSVISIFILILAVLNISVSYSAMQHGYAILQDYAMRDAAGGIPDASEKPGIAENTEVNAPEDGKDGKTSDPQENPVSRTEGHFPAPDRNWFDDMRVLYVAYGSAGNIEAFSTGGNPDMTEDDLLSMASRVLQQPKEKGRLGPYLYLLSETKDGTCLYFLDYGMEKSMSLRLLRICLYVGLLGIVLIFIPVFFLSRWTTKPVQTAFDKQKQFIADASHELKTPLTIITTNAEVLRSSLPDNKWLFHILEQTDRMKVLINDLLSLARLDSYAAKQDFLPMDLSSTVKNAALSFESLAFEYQKQFTMDIQDGLTLNGNEGNIRQLVTILLDNAFKYSGEHGTVSISLSSHGDKKILLVRNTGNGIPAEDQKHVFERFYRSDASRNRKYGGYGLGLAIASSIVAAHKGQLTVKSDESTYTAFTATFQ